MRFILLIFIFLNQFASLAHAGEDLCPLPILHYGNVEKLENRHYLHHLGVTITPTGGSHIAWKYAGKDGFPTTITLKAPATATLHPQFWPHPEPHYTEDGTFHYIYNSPITIPINIETSKISGKKIKLDINYVACGQLCVPCHHTLSLKSQKPSHADQALLASLAPHLANLKEERQYQEIMAGTLPAQHGRSHLFFMLCFAFIGGILLNFMPCVLPVLAMKLLHFIRHDDTPTLTMRQEFLATFLGIVCTYLLLALVFIIIKSTGKAVGLGMHFQEPLFIGLLACVTFAFALNLFGLFDFALPARFISRLNTIDTKWVGWGKHFFNGVLACVLSTPCSAPFIGTAASFAFTHNNSVLLAVFLTMSLGLGMPYVLLIFYPKLLRFLPKPGKWMVTLRRFLGCSLLLTSLWLSWVGIVQITQEKQQLSDNSSLITWENFSENKLIHYLKQDKVVVVNITAAWCMTCHINHMTVWNRHPIQQALKDANATMLEANYTKQDTDITHFMAKYHRHSIPTILVFGPQAKDGIVLSEILTGTALLNAIHAAAGHSK